MIAAPKKIFAAQTQEKQLTPIDKFYLLDLGNVVLLADLLSFKLSLIFLTKTAQIKKFATQT